VLRATDDAVGLMDLPRGPSENLLAVLPTVSSIPTARSVLWALIWAHNCHEISMAH
jgi:hypothetical protein